MKREKERKANKSTGRKSGIVNYTVEDFNGKLCPLLHTCSDSTGVVLNSIIREHLPIGQADWEVVCEEFNSQTKVLRYEWKLHETHHAVCRELLEYLFIYNLKKNF